MDNNEQNNDNNTRGVCSYGQLSFFFFKQRTWLFAVSISLSFFFEVYTHLFDRTMVLKD